MNLVWSYMFHSTFRVEKNTIPIESQTWQDEDDFIMCYLLLKKVLSEF
jgi:hypothetical protein